MKRALLLAVVGAVTFVANAAWSGQTFDRVRANGHVVCGVNLGLQGFSIRDGKGAWSGMDVDACRAVAAAVFGDAGRVRYVALSATDRMEALQSGRIDILARNTTWTLRRDTIAGFDFTVPLYYDGQGVMVPKIMNVSSLDQLQDVSVCVLPGTTSEQNLREYFTTRHIRHRLVTHERNEDLNHAFFTGRCQAISSDASQLAAIRATAPEPFDYVILPDMISKEPLAPVVRHGDEAWKDLVTWVIFAMIAAEEMGITSTNVEAMLSASDPNVAMFLGVIPGNGAALGVGERWAYEIIRQVGNYGEVFERNVGARSKLQLHRRLNRPYTQGGLLYAPPMK